MFSILFKETRNLNTGELPFFDDLNLKPVINEICKNVKSDYLRQVFSTMLQTDEEIKYRLDVFKDLENEQLRIKIASFANRLYSIVESYKVLKGIEKPNYADKVTLLDNIRLYIDILMEVKTNLELLSFSSLAIRKLEKYVDDLFESGEFKKLQTNLQVLDSLINKINFNMFLNEGYIYVTKPDSRKSNFSNEIKAVVSNLIDDDASTDIKVLDKSLSVNVKKNMLTILAVMYKEQFEFLNSFFDNFIDYIPQDLLLFPQEFFFYTAYLAFMDKIKTLGLSFCIPSVSTSNKNMDVVDTYDLALAHSFLYMGDTIIPNSFYLKGKERTFIISGPNQGGKTTFARMFGQLTYLASLGVPVPGSSAMLYAPDQIFTHFEVEETIIKASGKLNEELVRLKEILDSATSRSVIILNEIFASTSIADGVELGKLLLNKVKEKDMVCVFVTFLDDLSRLNDTIVSIVSTVIPEHPEVRTLKIVRKEADGLAYADAIAKKYNLDYSNVKRRLKK